MKVAECGTRSGARRHRRLKEPLCEACRDAERAYKRSYMQGYRDPLSRAQVTPWRRPPKPEPVPVADDAKALRCRGSWNPRTGSVIPCGQVIATCAPGETKNVEVTCACGRVTKMLWSVMA